MRNSNQSGTIICNNARNDVVLGLTNKTVREVINQIKILSKSIHDELICLYVEVFGKSFILFTFLANIGIKVSQSRNFFNLLVRLLIFATS